MSWQAGLRKLQKSPAVADESMGVPSGFIDQPPTGTWPGCSLTGYSLRTCRRTIGENGGRSFDIAACAVSYRAANSDLRPAFETR